MLKAYKFRMYPNKQQEELIRKHIGCCRYIYNHSLSKKIEAYETEGKSLSQYDLNKLIPKLKEEFEWLKEINSQSLQQANNHLDCAFKKFFREKKGFPNFKSRKNPVQSFTVPQHYKVCFEENKVIFPKIGKVKTKLHRKFKGDCKSATVSRTSTGKYFVSVLVEDGKDLPKKKRFGVNNAVGIDVGLTHFAVLSTGEKIDNPKFLKKGLSRLNHFQRQASRKQKGSSNQKKAYWKVALMHEKIGNQRRDFLHKLTHRIVGENQAIAIESLNVKGMASNHCLAQGIYDVSWSEFFRQLEYKSEWMGKTKIEIGRFEPSSKLCNVCGEINHNLTLADREWTCSNCRTHHDRDENAAINIKKFALQDQNLIGQCRRNFGVKPVEMSSVEESKKQEAPLLVGG
jgi:putative transposase